MKSKLSELVVQLIHKSVRTLIEADICFQCLVNIYTHFDEHGTVQNYDIVPLRTQRLTYRVILVVSDWVMLTQFRLRITSK